MTRHFFIHNDLRILAVIAVMLIMAETDIYAGDNTSRQNMSYQESNEKKQVGVFTNRFADNWELSFGIEGLSFYSGNESGLSKNPFMTFRSNLGATATVGKWFTPEIGLRTKISGYWGKAVISENSEKNKIKFFSAQEQVMLNVTNLFKGYNPNRFWNIIPYGGVGFVRSCTYNENSISVSAGVINTFRLSSQIKAFADLGVTFAGDNYRDNNVSNIMGRYHWYAASVGFTFNLGKNAWSRHTNRKQENQYLAPVITSYEELITKKNIKVEKQRIIANDPVPYGMVLVNRGHLRMGLEMEDSLWGFNTPVRDVSIDDFWMDRTETTNAQYRRFVNEVFDSLVSERMKDSTYHKSRALARASFYKTNPVTGEKQLDTRQLWYKYETYDYTESMKRKYRQDPKERILNTDLHADSLEEVWISKDTTYVDGKGNIIRETINRPYTGAYDFLNTYIVHIYPDTTCWVNDFPNANNDVYARYYFSHPDYQNYPVVGVSWEQANAYCAWRTLKEQKDLGVMYGDRQPYRLPTEAEWEYAARGHSQNDFPWLKAREGEGKGLFFANFMPAEGDFTSDGNIITSRVGIYPSNTNGLYDMAGNVAEWTSTLFTAAGVEAMNTINPELSYNAAVEDPYALKLKSVKGGSWKDSESHIRSAWRTSEYQNQPRSYIGFRCVRSIAATPSEKTVLYVSRKK